MSRTTTYHVYVVELDPAVWADNRFRWHNHHRTPGAPCVYVGQTALKPEERLARHTSGQQSNPYVRRYGRRLLPQLTGPIEARTRRGAVREEARLADQLRQRGWAVWSR